MFNFDLSNGYVILRIMCGFFFLPHALGKILDRPGITGFYNAARLHPAGLWINAAIVAELIMGPARILGVNPPYPPMSACFFLCVAVVALLRAKPKHFWLWNLAGIEYPVFW